MAVVSAVLVLVLVSGSVAWWAVVRRGPAPRGLAAASVLAESVSLRWAPQPYAETAQRYVVRQDGAPIARLVSRTAYDDAGLTPQARYVYSVTAITGARESDPTPDLVVWTLPRSPGDARVEWVTTTLLDLVWTPPGGPAPSQYVIQRDRIDTATVPGSQVTFHDTGLLPATRCRYTVIAVTGVRRSAPTPVVEAPTSQPPVTDGRLGGG